MADLLTTAYTVIFIGVLLIVGIIIMAYVADPMGDQFHSNELLIAAGCSDDNSSTEVTLCSGTVDNPPIENVTRAAPVVTNCTATMTDCQTMTAGTHYNYSKGSGTFRICHDNSTIADTYNGTIYISYWEDAATDNADNAQQSITSTAYGGFELAVVMLIVMAAVGIVSTIFLIGRRGA